MLSFPHFYLADPSLRERVEGISEPVAEDHRLYIDVQPVSISPSPTSNSSYSYFVSYVVSCHGDYPYLLNRGGLCCAATQDNRLQRE